MPAWWIALGLILAFIPYFPYTKHFHLIMSGINFLTKPKRTSLGELEPINFEDETIEEFGVAKIEQLPWTHLVDAYACIMCNRCQDVCPAYTTGKELSPSALEINKRYYLNEQLTELAGGGRVRVPAARLRHQRVGRVGLHGLRRLRQHLPGGQRADVRHPLHPPQPDADGKRVPAPSCKQAYRGMERNGNPWNLSPPRPHEVGGRPRRADGRGEPRLRAAVVGGLRARRTTRARRSTARAFAKVLNAAGVNYAMLGEMERCTGDSARRSGNEALFFELAQGQHRDAQRGDGRTKRKRIVTTCPHCLHTLGKEYDQYGGNYEVIHHTQLHRRADGSQSKLSRAAGTAKWTRSPSTIPATWAATTASSTSRARRCQGTNAFIIEMPRHGKQSFCCGAGGAQMWKEEEHGTAAVNMTRYEEAAATGAKTIAVGCPFCLTMLTDASKQADQGIEVKDIVELVAEGLPKS